MGDADNDDLSSSDSSTTTTTKPSSVAAFGNRRLGQDDNVYSHNAWDHVQWDDAKEAAAAAHIAAQRRVPMPEERKVDLEVNAARYWDQFYAQHTNRFFKDRHWLGIEFPVLVAIGADATAHTVLEVGCGVGNTVFPLLAQVTDPRLFVWACDFAPTAVEIVKASPTYDAARCCAFVCDIANDPLTPPVPHDSVDVASMIFVLSALRPDKFETALRAVFAALRPGGRLLFRDYGRYDLAQLRFKPHARIEDNMYVRGDGTRVYFFTLDEVKALMERVGFEVEQHVADRRLLVNRAQKLQMHRVWLQGQYRKPLLAPSSSSSSQSASSQSPP